MKKEDLEKRLQLIEENISKHNKNIEQLVANLNVLTGAKNECLFWLSQNEEIPHEVVAPNEVVAEDEAVSN